MSNKVKKETEKDQEEDIKVSKTKLPKLTKRQWWFVGSFFTLGTVGTILGLVLPNVIRKTDSSNTTNEQNQIKQQLPVNGKA